MKSQTFLVLVIHNGVSSHWRGDRVQAVLQHSEKLLILFNIFSSQSVVTDQFNVLGEEFSKMMLGA